MNYFECMPGLRVLGRHSHGRALAPCRRTAHPSWVEMQNTQRRLRMQALGAELARIRKAAGMSKQEDLEERSGVGVRTISDIETGKKVARINTMRKLEAALGLEPGATDSFMAGEIESLAERTASDREDPQRVAEKRQHYSRDDIELAVLLARRGLAPDEVFRVIDEPPKAPPDTPWVEPPTGTDQ